MAIIEFEEHKAVLNVLKKQPIIFIGAEVCISIYDEEEPESCIQTKIKVTGIPDNIDEVMLEMFFENTKKQGGGKIKSVDLNKQKKTAVIDFEEPEAVLKVMEKQPIIMFGSDVCVTIYDEGEPETCNPTKIKVTGLPENVDEDMLEMFFENTKKQGGGKVKSVDLNKQKKTAVIDFEEPEAVLKVMEKQPIVFFGTDVCVSIYDEEEPETCSPTKIKVTGLPENVDEDMLEMFFENTKKQGGGKVKSVDLNKQNKTAVIDFEEHEAVLKVLEKQPIVMFGSDVSVSIYKAEEELETRSPTKIKVTGIPESVDEEMLEMFFENTKKGGGKVKSVNLNTQEKMAVIEFEEPEAVVNVLKKRPIILSGAEMGVSVYGTEKPKSLPPTDIKVTGLPDNVSEESLELFFENTKKQGGGTVRSVTINRKTKVAIVTFEDPEAVLKVLEKQPISLYGTLVGVSAHIEEEEPKSLPPTAIKVTGLPDSADEEMLELFFENTKKQGGGTVRSVTINRKTKVAIVNFEDPEAVFRVLEKQPILLFGTEVGVIVYDKEQSETCGPTRIKVTGLPENVDEDILGTFFENTKKQGGGEVKSITLNKQKKTAIIEFQEHQAVLKVLEKQPFSILGTQVDVSIHGDNEPEDLLPTTIMVTGLPENIDEDTLESFFENVKKQGGGSVKRVFLNKKKKLAFVDFEEAQAVERVLSKQPISILGTEVGVSVQVVFPKLSTIKVTGLPDNIDEETLELCFENTKKQGGGKVLSVKLEKANKLALVEFEDPEAVKTVLMKQPIKILGKEVNISLYDALDIDVPGVDQIPSEIVEQISRIYVSEIPQSATQELLWDFFENKNRNGVGTVNHVDLNTTDMTAIVEFEDAEVVEQITKRKAVHFKGRTMKIRKLDAALYIEVQQKLGFYSVLKKIGLTDKYPGKIKLADIVTLDPNLSDVQTSSKLTDVPWMFLRRLISTHSDARDMAVVTKENEEGGDMDCMLSFVNRSQTDDADDEISPLDVYFVIFQCCDPILKQIMFQKLYLCKMAVPFLYSLWNEGFQVPTLAIWPLRSLAIENKGKANQSEIKCKEADVLELPTKTIAFARYGRPRYSKSKLLNSLLSIHGCKTFYNIDCPSGMTPRCLSNGHIEIFWLPNIGDKRDQFQDPVTFLNMRGDLQVNFKEDVVSFMANIVDTFIIIIDTESLSKFKTELENLVHQFPSVIFLIANSIQEHERTLIETFKQSLCEAKPTLTLKFLGTHRGNIEQNVVDMVATVLKNISNAISAVTARSIEFKLKNIKTYTIQSDEDVQHCRNGKEKAEKLLTILKREGEPKIWKQVVTPIQCKFSKDLGQLMKRGAREKVIEGTEKNEKKIKEVRLETTQNITNGLKAFVNILINHGDDLELEFFLGWLKFFIDREKRMILPQLMFGYRCAWEKLKEMKAKEKEKGSQKEEEEKIVDTIKKFELEIDDASFSVEHLFRELGHVYDAFLETNTTVVDAGLPELERVTDVIASCVSKGHQFEIIDGESFFMPHMWIKKVFDKLKCFIGTKRILTLSVLGLQSSGKSTLLNTMFGSQFSARTGRCTRGIHMQLIPVSTNFNKEDFMPFDYVAVIDTEGLRSPELRNIMHEHDNELATVITGIGDITMLNIMGENTNEIRDILQVIVHAFLRLRRTNRNLDITKSCCFIHQNVTDTSASENMLSGLSKLLQILDEMTKESARSEGILDITSFNQVIEFDINSQVWYLKNLWQGNPPMARVNYEYSESVVAIKRKLMLKAISMKEKSYKSVQDILIQAHNLWKGVLSEDFVFSFRNSLEIKAYTEMEAFIQNLSWKLESLVQTKLTDKALNNFASCNHKDQLTTISENTEMELLEFLNEEKAKIEEEITTYFKNNQYKEIIIQWKQTQKIRMEILCGKLTKNIKDKIVKHCDKRAIEILTVSNHSKHEEKLWEKSREVANNFKGKSLAQKEIDNLFEEIWKSFVQNVTTSSYQSTVKGLQAVFIQQLYDMFNTERQLVTEYLKISNKLSIKPNFHQLNGSFGATCIDDNDVSFSILRRGKDGFGLIKDSMKHVEKHVESLYECFDGKIRRLDQTDDEITDHEISKLLHQLQQGIHNILKGTKDFDFKKTFYVKIYVHVSNFACHVFNEHNEKYHRIQGGQVRLDKYKQQQKISFEAHLSNRQYEDTIASLLSNVLEVFAREKSQEPIQNSATDFLFSKLPKVKNQVIFNILTDLATNGKFEKFIDYIKTPQSYAEVWLENRCYELLFDENSNDSFFTLGKRIIGDIFKQVKRCVEKFRGQQTKKQSTFAIEEFVEQLNTYLKEEKLVVPLESFRTLLNQTGDIENILYLSDAIVAHITDAEQKLLHEIENTNKKTVEWTGTNPIDRIIKKVWGCPEQCPFCGEPCAKNDEHTHSDHYSIQHRPSCCKGIRKSSTNRACLESCNFDIQSDQTHTCGVFGYLCNNPKRKDCSSKTHNYKDYKRFCGRWDIPPSSNMHDTSQFWLWFVGKYKEDLAKFYSYEISHAPAEWGEITQDQALKSLKDKYFV